MLIAVTDERGVTYPAMRSTPNMVHGVPAGVRVRTLRVDAGVEACDFVSDGEPIVVSLPAIRRVRATRRAA